MKSLQQILSAACAQRDEPWALATLVRAEGSTYRQPGARMLVRQDGTTIGVLSGGCLEEEIARRAQPVIAEGTTVLCEFDTRRLYGCEGKLHVFIERIPPAGDAGNFLTAVAGKLAARALCRTITDYGHADGASVLIDDHALVVERPGLFMQTIPLPIRLLLFGTGPEIAPLRWFAAGLGWETVEHAHPDELATDFRRDDQTAAVVMTHNFGRDLAALDRLLPLGLPYLGLLGPKRRHAELLARLQEYQPLDATSLATLHAPAGLDIGSESPEEIALSIVSETAAVLAGREGGMLRQRAGPIHSAELPGREA